MKHLVEFLAGLVVLIGWLAGIVFAHGFWSTTFAILMPPYAWYLVVERVIQHFGPIA